MRKIQENPRSCPVTRTGGYIGGKWKPIILVLLMDVIIRFGELSLFLPTIRTKLTQKLRELVEDVLMIRSSCSEKQTRVLFDFSDNGKTLISVIQAMYNREQYFKEVAWRAIPN